MTLFSPAELRGTAISRCTSSTRAVGRCNASAALRAADFFWKGAPVFDRYTAASALRGVAR